MLKFGLITFTETMLGSTSENDGILTKLTFTTFNCLKSTIELIKKDVKYVQS